MLLLSCTIKIKERFENLIKCKAIDILELNEKGDNLFNCKLKFPYPQIGMSSLSESLETVTVEYPTYKKIIILIR